MAGLHEIVFGGGDQPLIHVPVAVVASATYVVEDLMSSVEASDRTIVASASATVDSTSMTTTALAGPSELDTRLVLVDDETGAVAGSTYAIVSPDGRYELFEAEGVDVDTIYAANPLSGSYPIGSTVQGVQVSGTFPSASAANDRLHDEDRPLRVTWRYALGGTQVAVWEQIRIVQRRFSAAYLADVELAVRDEWPEVVKEYGAPRLLRAAIKAADREIRWTLAKRQVDLDQFLTSEGMMQVYIRGTLSHMAEQGVTPNELDGQQFAEDMRRRFMRDLDRAAIGAVARGNVDIIRGDDQASSPHSSRVVSVTCRP